MTFKINWKIFFIVFILLIAFTLRVINLDTIEVQTDEGNYALRGIGWNDFMFSSTLTTPWNWFIEKDELPWWTKLSFNDHPPLHFATIWLSTHIFGISLWAVRLPAVIFGVLSVLLVILILYQLNLKKGALWAGLFLAVLPWHIYICQQAIQESGLIFLILLTICLLLITERKNNWYWWVLSGISFGAAILMKYSAIVISPLIIYWFFKKRWYKKIYFWLMPICTFITFSPVIIYNIKTYIYRGHFDLQFSRFLGQDTTVDWKASYQGIWQGSLKSIFSFYLGIANWISITTAVFILLGLWLVWKKRKQLSKNSLIISYGMFIIVSIFSVLTLSDFGRSSILIPFIVLIIGLVANFLDFDEFKLNNLKQSKINFNKILASIFLISLIIVSFVSIADHLKKEVLSDKIIHSFRRSATGFLDWEKWLNENQRPKQKPKHFTSFKNWILYTSELINSSELPIIVFDKRISWFGSNWYFYRHSFYTYNYPVVHSSIFVYLILQNLLNLDSKDIYYVQIAEASQDTKPTFDNFSRLIDKAFYILAKEQNPQPFIIKNSEGVNFVTVWPLTWDSEMTISFEE